MLAKDVLTEEWLADVLQDSLDMDGTTTDFARAIMRALENGLIELPQRGGQVAAITAGAVPASAQVVPSATRRLDWRKVAQMAGEHGVRYPTNVALVKFLDAVLVTSAPVGHGVPVEPTALDASIAELEAFERDGTILDEIDDWSGFAECVMLCLHELKRLRAQADVQAKLDQYRKAWEALFGPLSWMQHSDQLMAYMGWGLSEIANDLIDRAYPGLRSSAVAAMEARPHG